LLTPELMTVLMLYMIADGNRRGYRHLLRGFWDEASAHGLLLPCENPISAPSFCAARQKLAPDLMRDLLYEIAWTNPSSELADSRRWRGRRVFAVDGTKVNLQRSPELQYAFGGPTGAYCPQVLLSVMVDVCARIPMDLEVSPYATSERDHLDPMLGNLESGDILVVDRGYYSHHLLQYATWRSIDYLLRIPMSSFAEVDDFSISGEAEREVVIEVPEDGGPGWLPVQARLVRVEGPDGEDAFYVTSLSRDEFSRADIAELYHLRWEAEEFFKLLKSSYAGQGQFRSRSASGVLQEIYATVLYLAIARLFVHAASPHVVGAKKYPSQKGAVLILASFFTRIFLQRNRSRAREALAQALERITSTCDTRRPGRSWPRRSYRPKLRWCAKGRHGA
jgi:hypothetical protein